MPQFGAMHVTLPLDSHYSSWVFSRDNLAPLVSVCGGEVLVVSVGYENQYVNKRISKVRYDCYYRVKCFSTYVWVVYQVFPWVCSLVALDYSCEASSTRAPNLRSFCFVEYVRCSITHVWVTNSIRPFTVE